MKNRANKRARSSDGKRRHTSLRELAALFLKLGTIAFGGPAAHIAMMEDDVVRRRRWSTHDEFLDLLGTTNLIPGPNSTEMAIHIGHRRAGWKGLVVAGASFILPAGVDCHRLRMGLCSLRINSPSQRCALRNKASHYRDRSASAVVARTCGHEKQIPGVDRHCSNLTYFFGTSRTSCSPGRRLGSGSGSIDRVSNQRATKLSLVNLRVALILFLQSGTTNAATASFSLALLFLFFLKVGAVLYGSGYVLLAFIRADLVERWHWLTESQLLDAIAVGQVTRASLPYIAVDIALPKQREFRMIASGCFTHFTL